MNRGANSPIKGFVPGLGAVHAAMLGAGAADLTLPANGVLTDAAAGLYPKAANFALTGVRQGSAGIFVITLSDSAKNILWADGIVVSDGGAPTAALEVVVTKITPPNTLTIKIVAPNGTLTDPGTSDLVILKIDIADTGAIG